MVLPSTIIVIIFVWCSYEILPPCAVRNFCENMFKRQLTSIQYTILLCGYVIIHLPITRTHGIISKNKT